MASTKKPSKLCSHVSDTGFKCNGESYKRGLCNKHYFRQYRGNDMDRARGLSDEEIKIVQTSLQRTRVLAMQYGCSESRIRAIRHAYRETLDEVRKTRRRQRG